MRKVREFISMVNKDNHPWFNSRAFYFLTDKGEINNHTIYVEILALTENGEEVKFLQSITVEHIELALVDKTIIFDEMVNKFFDFVEQKYGPVNVIRRNK